MDVENGTFWSEIRVWIWKTQVAQPHQKFRRAEPPRQKEETELHHMNLNLADLFLKWKTKNTYVSFLISSDCALHTTTFMQLLKTSLLDFNAKDSLT